VWCGEGLAVAERVTSDSGIDSLLPAVVFSGGTDDGTLDIVVEGEQELCGGSLAVALDEFLHGGGFDVLGLHWVERLLGEGVLLVILGGLDIPVLDIRESGVEFFGEATADIGVVGATLLVPVSGGGEVFLHLGAEFGDEPSVVFV
jgi:hypothetical protein